MLLISFGRPLLSKILFKVEEWEIVKNYSLKSEEIKGIIEFSKKLEPIEFSIQKKNKIQISFSDSLTRNSNYTMHLNHIQLTNEDNKIIEIDKEHNLTLQNSDSIIKYTYWTCYYSGTTDDQNLNKLLKYYGWSPVKLEELIAKVKSVNCIGFQKDCIGDIVLNYSVINLYPNTFYYIPRFRVFNYIITENFNRYENTKIKKLDKNVYWWDNQYLFCNPPVKGNNFKTKLN